MLSFLENLFWSILSAVELFLIANVISIVTGWSNLRFALDLWQVRRLAMIASSRTLFATNNGELVATTYDSRSDTERSVVLYRSSVPASSLITSKNGRFTNTELKRRATLDIVRRMVVAALATIPLLSLGIWLASHIDPKWWYAVILLGLVYIATWDLRMVLVFKRIGPFAVIAGVELLHRVTDWSLFSAETKVHIACVYSIVAVVGYWLITRHSISAEKALAA